MKAKTEFVSNHQEIEQAHKLGYEVPKPESKIIDFYFDINGVVAMFVNMDGNINISLFGEIWTIQFDEATFKALEQHMNK